jgi:hypothetical protein
MVKLRKGKKVYHGTSWDCENGKPFNKLGTDYFSGVAWFTDDKFVAQEFAEDKDFDNRDSKNHTPVILVGKTKKDLYFHNLDAKEVCKEDGYFEIYDKDNDEYMEVDCVSMQDFYDDIVVGVEDVNEIYYDIDQKKYDGGYREQYTPSGMNYDDYSVFNPDETLEFTHVIIDDEKTYKNLFEFSFTYI